MNNMCESEDAYMKRQKGTESKEGRRAAARK